MTENKICNGIVSPRKCYSQKKANELKPMIKKVRAALLKEFGGRDDEKMIFAGLRFNDDDSVIARLESANQDLIKRYGWEQAIRSAMIDCMSSDYYYTFEKDYGEAE